MLNERIRELRIAHGYSQVALGEKLGVSKQAVSNWENDNIQPSIEMLVRLADLFCVTTDYLLGREHGLMADLTGLDRRTAAHVTLLINDLLSGSEARTAKQANTGKAQEEIPADISES